MWSDIVEFRSVSSEIRGRKNKEEDDDETLVKYKSVDNYVGQPNKFQWRSWLTGKFCVTF